MESLAKATKGKAGMAVGLPHVRRSTAGTGLQVGVASAVLPATSEFMDVTAGETAPKEKWIIGYTSWGQQVGKFHEWVGPCEWVGDHFEFANTDFDVFPLPTHWMPLPAPPHSISAQERET